MFPEFGYIVNATQMQYYKYKHFTGENKIIEALKMGWQVKDKYVYMEKDLDIQDYKNMGYKNITDLKRPHSA
jgi:hypothetical protein